MLIRTAIVAMLITGSTLRVQAQTLPYPTPTVPANVFPLGGFEIQTLNTTQSQWDKITRGMLGAGFNTIYFTQLYGGTAGNGDNQRLELGAQLPPGFMMIAPNGSQTPDKSLVQFGGRWGEGTCPEVRIFTLDDFLYHLDPSIAPDFSVVLASDVGATWQTEQGNPTRTDDQAEWQIPRAFATDANGNPLPPSTSVYADILFLIENNIINKM